MIEEYLSEKAHMCVEALRDAGLTIATAESCTGGLVSGWLTAVPGSSYCFHLGVVSYGNQAKRDVLGVKAETLEKFGSVSEQTAREMALGMRKLSHADIAVAITGIAGPDGGSPEKPVGLVFCALASDLGVEIKSFQFSGNRHEIRIHSCREAFKMIAKAVAGLQAGK
jgi:PncC family amidohydrolase